MRVRPVATIVACALCAPAAWAQDGLKPSLETSWGTGWQTRLSLLGVPAVPAAALDDRRVVGAQLFGDYYLFELRTLDGRYSGGLRATTGLSVGTSVMGWGVQPGFGGLPAWRAWPGGGDGTAALPYLGIGVTGLSLRGGWGLSADLGLAGHGAAGDTHPATGGSAEDLLRELRLTPTLQLGVSYAF